MDEDLTLAKELQAQFDMEYLLDQNGSSDACLSQAKHCKEVDPELELEDPIPNIYELFTYFNIKYFEGKLGSVEVKWSNRMYSCAGTCSYRTGAGCVVTLSAPLLKFRPRKDLAETLLHEMIHAYLFVAYKNEEHEEHGPMFHQLMYKINKESGANITVYHTFHDEVDHHKTHWWKCNGPCSMRHPYYGIVKRSSNRAPGPYDFWFNKHKLECGGEFMKIKEPDGYKSRKSKDSKMKQTAGKQESNLQTFFETSHDNKYVSGIHKQNNIHGFNGLSKSSVTTSKNKTAGPTKTLKNLHEYEVQSNFSNAQNLSSNTQNCSTSWQSKIDSWIKPDRSFLGKASPQTSASNIHSFNFGRNNAGLSNVAQGLVSNRGGTLIERPKTLTTSVSSGLIKKVREKACAVPFSGKGYLLQPDTKSSGINRANSKLLKLFPESTSETHLTNKRKSNLMDCKILHDEAAGENSQQGRPSKHCYKDEFFNHNKSQEYKEEENIVVCPVCDAKYSTEKISNHVDECLENNSFN